MLNEDKVLDLYKNLKKSLEELYEIRFYDEEDKYRDLPNEEMKDLYSKMDILKKVLEIK
jgi:hypothetical protein